MSVEIDSGGMDSWLDASVGKLRGAIRPVVSKGALNVKKAMQDDFKASVHFKQVAAGVTYDVESDRDGVEAVIGPDADRRPAANLANIAYFGGAHGGGGTVRDPQLAAEDEADAFEKFLGDALQDVF